MLFAGNVGEAQDIDAVLKAAKITSDQKNIRWLIAGKGRDWERIKQKIDRLGLYSVEMLGQFPLEKMPELYAAADALLICLKSDPLFSITVPGKLQTCLLSRKPILGMLDGEGAILIEKAKAGLTCKSGDYKNLAKNAQKLSKMSKEERILLGENGRKYVERNFNRTNIINEFEKLITKN
ncbi:glycosyltransferase family 4 protein [Alphaproteobacteria bacterium]|nr:glycosyltransferase family 4 protein [Alphaproteobacteria bacterium]